MSNSNVQKQMQYIYTVTSRDYIHNLFFHVLYKPIFARPFNVILKTISCKGKT